VKPKRKSKKVRDRKAAPLCHIAVCSIFLVLVVWSASQVLIDHRVKKGSDAVGFIVMGHNIQRHKTCSMKKVDNPAPTVYREPGYSTYLAMIMALSRQLREADVDTVLSGGTEVQILRRGQLPVLILTAFMAMYVVFSVTRNVVFSYIALFLTGFSSSLLTSMQSLKSEFFSALLLLVVSIFMYQAVTVKSKKYFALLGVSLGALVLTKAVFMYFIVFVFIFFIFLWKLGLFEKRRLITGLLMFISMYCALVGSWMFRNYIHFKHFYITGRAGLILSVRSQYDMMNAQEYFGSFLYWTPDQYVARKLLTVFWGRDALGPRGALWRLNRSNSSGYYKRGRAVRDAILEKSEHRRETAAVDRQTKKEAIGKILRHPFRHILVTLPLGWRGLFVESGYVLRAPFTVAVVSSIAISLAYFGSFFFLAFSSIKRRRWELFAIILPGLYLYGMHSFFTHSLARYNDPLIPVLVVSLLLVVNMLINRKRFGSA